MFLKLEYTKKKTLSNTIFKLFSFYLSLLVEKVRLINIQIGSMNKK